MTVLIICPLSNILNMVRKISDMQVLIIPETERIINPQLLKFPMTHSNPVYKIYLEDFFLKNLAGQ